MKKPVTAALRKKLEQAAKKVMRHAHAPYSKFHVGAAILLTNGRIFSGCNVENASYGMTNCAERTAIFSAVAELGPKIEIRAVAVTNDHGVACSPCGACRQVIYEFGPDATVFFQGRIYTGGRMTHSRSEARSKNFGENIESDLALEFLRVVENAAIESARTMGQGDRPLSDQVATESMRKTMDTVPMHGTIVIGEGERDDAPMLYIGEQVGGTYSDGREVPHVDIAVDPLEGTNLCATGAPGSITVLAASEKGGLLHAPDCYMEKIVVGPSCKNAIDLDAPVADNLRNIAKRMNRDVEDLVVIVLDRPRHEKLIADIRAAGARIRLIGDGDLSAGIAAAVIGTGVHAVMGSGGAPEGVITAAAIRCL